MKYKLVISDRKVDGHSLDEVENHQKMISHDFLLILDLKWSSLNLSQPK